MRLVLICFHVGKQYCDGYRGRINGTSPAPSDHTLSTTFLIICFANAGSSKNEATKEQTSHHVLVLNTKHQIKLCNNVLPGNLPAGADIVTGLKNAWAPLVEGVAGTGGIVVVIVVVSSVFAAPFISLATTLLTSSEQFSRV